jgi:hypothetical protein
MRTLQRITAAALLGALLAAPGARAEETSNPNAPPDARFVIGPGNEAYAAALPGNYAAGIAGYRLRGTAIARDRIVYDYAGEPDGGFSVVLRHPKDSASSRRSKYFAIDFDFRLQDPDRMDSLAGEIAAQIQARDVRDIWLPADAASQEPRPLGLFAALLALSAAILVFGISKEGRAGLLAACDGLQARLEQPGLLLEAAVLAGALFLRFFHSRLPAFEGGEIMRLFIAYLPPLDNLVHSHDARHPGLYFAVVHWPLVLSGFSVAAVRAVGIAFSAAAVVLAGAVVRRHAGRGPALAAMALLAASPVFLRLSREIGDFSLFVMLALAAILSYQRALDTASRADKALLALSAGLCLLSSYAAVTIYAALALHALLDQKRRQQLAWPLGLALLIGTPAVVQLALMMPRELAEKRLAVSAQVYLWGSGGPGELARDAARELFTQRLWPLALSAAALAVLLNWSRLAARGPIALIAACNLALLGGASLFRMKPYYAVFLQVAAILLVASLMEPLPRTAPLSLGSYARRLAPPFALVILGAAFTLELHRDWESLYIQGANFRTSIRAPLEQVKQDGGTTVIFEVGHDKVSVAYHFFEKPFESFANFFRPDPARRPCGLQDGYLLCCDEGSARCLYVLSEGIRLPPDWKALAVPKLDALLAAGPAHFLYDLSFPNEPLRARLEAACAPRYRGSRYQLYSCPARKRG